MAQIRDFCYVCHLRVHQRYVPPMFHDLSSWRISLSINNFVCFGALTFSGFETELEVVAVGTSLQNILYGYDSFPRYSSSVLRSVLFFNFLSLFRI